MNLYKKDLDKVVSYFKRELVGPFNGDDEILQNDKPNIRYLMGTLYPQQSVINSNYSDSDEDNPSSDEESVGDSPLSMIFQDLPASMGLSFYVEGCKQIKIEAWAGVYLKQNVDNDSEDSSEDVVKSSKKRSKTIWQRISLATESKPFDVICSKFDHLKYIDLFGGRAQANIVWRSMEGKGSLITITLINKNIDSSESIIDPENCLFQAGFRCSPLQGEIKEYPLSNRLTRDDEEDELILQYQNKVTYAVGHGCAASWGNNHEYVETTSMPIREVKPATTKLDIKNSEVLSLNFLGNESLNKKKLIDSLNSFAESYEAWIKNLKKEKVNSNFDKAKQRIILKTSRALSRIKSGISILEKDELARKSFALANQAMLRQMIHTRDFSEPKNRDEISYERPNYYSDQYKDFKWRPFQLAFFLVVIESLVNEKSLDREVVDLIWFPTGGGKTEAYLALAAFELIYRRLRFKSKGSGTAVIMRYTLRLLTSQQFQRAAALISCLEIMRQERENDLGQENFDLGLWVGEASSPNTYTQENDTSAPGAYELYQELRKYDPPVNSFQLQKCPMCGTKIVPDRQTDDDEDFGIKATQSDFKFFCPTKTCDLHKKIPVTVVDADIYQHPPSFLIGTIDKFARLAWDHRAHNLFGNNEKGNMPPTLIIQDELHLISGPLGTISGIYEAAIDTVINAKGGTKPKYIAATATIRRAREQVRKLYASEVDIFPPPGLSSDDSFFTKTDLEATGRFYLGVMAQGHSQVTALVNTSAALSQSVLECDIEKQSRDYWWTQIIYHNSRRELGKTVNLTRDDIPARVKVIARDEDNLRKLDNMEELSSNIEGKNIPAILAKLEKSFNDDQAVDILPCTNMISVGVDVSRLGLMLVNGQPKTTAEYIQASSRVGRDINGPPGIVVTLYNPYRPRDKSHFENFNAYHQMLYRSVEPTSVTPFAQPARERALHAALIIVMRLAGNLGLNDQASLFDSSNTKIKALIESLITRMQKAEPEEKDNIEEHVWSLVEQWEDKILSGNGKTLRYDKQRLGKQYTSLITQYNSNDKESWRTLNSMRNVDSEITIKIAGE